MRLTVALVEMGLGDVKISSHTDDFDSRALADVVNTPAFNKQIVEAWLKVAREHLQLPCHNIPLRSTSSASKIHSHVLRR